MFEIQKLANTENDVQKINSLIFIILYFFSKTNIKNTKYIIKVFKRKSNDPLIFKKGNIIARISDTINKTKDFERILVVENIS